MIAVYDAVRRHVCRFGNIMAAYRNENLIFNLIFLQNNLSSKASPQH